MPDTTKKPYFTKLDPALREAMRRFKADVGVPEAQQIDRALRQWLNERGVVVEATPQRPVARKRRKGTR